MNYKILVDSCCDLPKEIKKQPQFQVIPLTIELDDERFIDDETLNPLEYLEKMKKCDKAPKTSCPSPEDYMKYYKGEEEAVFVVTLSDKLSGSYNSAELAKQLYIEEEGDTGKLINVFNSFSASVGETLIALKIEQLAKLGESAKDIVEIVTKYAKEMKTYFVLESLDNLKKAGRLNNIQALIANVLNIKPVMGSDGNGFIIKLDNTRGMKKALSRMIDLIGSESEKLSEKICGIAHCNCLDRALKVKEEIIKRYNFIDVIIVETAGISTTYANDGGIVIAF